MGFLIFALLIFFLAIWLAMNVVAYSLQQNDIGVDEDGNLCLPEKPEEDVEFTYCFKPALFEAFQVSGKYLPPWAISDQIQMQILPKPQITIQTNGEEVIANETDYVARNSTGSMWVISEEDMREGFVKIKIDQEEDE